MAPPKKKTKYEDDDDYDPSQEVENQEEEQEEEEEEEEEEVEHQKDEEPHEDEEQDENNDSIVMESSNEGIIKAASKLDNKTNKNKAANAAEEEEKEEEKTNPKKMDQLGEEDVEEFDEEGEENEDEEVQEVNVKVLKFQLRRDLLSAKILKKVDECPAVKTVDYDTLYNQLDERAKHVQLMSLRRLLSDCMLERSLAMDRIHNLMFYLNPKSHKQPPGYKRPITDIEAILMDPEQAKKQKELEAELAEGVRKKNEFLNRLLSARLILGDNIIDLKIQTENLNLQTASIQEIQDKLGSLYQEIWDAGSVSPRNKESGGGKEGKETSKQTKDAGKDKDVEGNDEDIPLGGLGGVDQNPHDNNDDDKKIENDTTITVTPPVKTVTPTVDENPPTTNPPTTPLKHKNIEPKTPTEQQNKQPHKTPNSAANKSTNDSMNVSPSPFDPNQFLNPHTPAGNDKTNDYSDDDKEEEDDTSTSGNIKTNENTTANEMNELFTAGSETTSFIDDENKENSNVSGITSKKQSQAKEQAEEQEPPVNIKPTSEQYFEHIPSEGLNLLLEDDRDIESGVSELAEIVPPNTTFIPFGSTYQTIMTEFVSPTFGDYENNLVRFDLETMDGEMLRLLLAANVELIKQEKEKYYGTEYYNASTLHLVFEKLEEKAKRAYLYLNHFLNNTPVEVEDEEDEEDEEEDCKSRVVAEIYALNAQILKYMFSHYRLLLPIKLREFGVGEEVCAYVFRTIDLMYEPTTKGDRNPINIIDKYVTLKRFILFISNEQAICLYQQGQKHFATVIGEIAKIYNVVKKKIDKQTFNNLGGFVNLVYWVKCSKAILAQSFPYRLGDSLESVDRILIILLETFPGISNFVSGNKALVVSGDNDTGGGNVEEELILIDDEEDEERQIELYQREQLRRMEEENEQRQGGKCSSSSELPSIMNPNKNQTSKIPKHKSGQQKNLERASELLGKVKKDRTPKTLEALEATLFEIIFSAHSTEVVSALSNFNFDLHCTETGISQQLFKCLVNDKLKHNKSVNIWYIYLAVIEKYAQKNNMSLRDYLGQLFKLESHAKAEQLYKKIKVAHLILKYPPLYKQKVAVVNGVREVIEQFSKLLMENNIPLLLYDPLEVIKLSYLFDGKPNVGESCLINTDDLIAVDGIVVNYYYDYVNKVIMVKVMVGDKEYSVKCENITKK